MLRLGFLSSAFTAAAGLVVLVFAGLVLLIFLAAYALAAAIAAIVPVIYLDARREWNVTGEQIGYVAILLLAFFVSGAFAFALDAVLGTYVSLPGMIAALDLTEMEHARYEPLVRSVLDYYAVALGPTPATWLRFLALHAAIVVVFAAVLLRTTPDESLEPAPLPRRCLRMLALSVVAVGISTFVAFPILVQVLLWVRAPGV
jgi:hypothetical protein